MQAIVIILVLAGVVGVGFSLARLASSRTGRWKRRALLASVMWIVSVVSVWEVSKESWARHHGFTTYSDYWKASQAGYETSADWYNATLTERARALAGVGPAKPTLRTATWGRENGS